MYLIVGLGNPGKEYENTRHNIGFDVIETLAAQEKIDILEKKHKGLVGKGYIDGELMFDKDLENGAKSESYQVVSTDASGDIIIKLVNVTDSARSFAIDIANADVKGTATVYQVAGDSLDNDNILGAKEDCIMEEFTVEGISGAFNYTVPMYSATVIRIAR